MSGHLACRMICTDIRVLLSLSRPPRHPADLFSLPTTSGRAFAAGHCKFGEMCKFDHPPKFAVKLNHAGLPLRPGEPTCSFYERFGDCKFGPSCKFHHPGRPFGAPAPAPPGGPPGLGPGRGQSQG